MTDTPEGASVELTVALNRFIDRLDHMAIKDRADSNAQITVNAGGTGLWLAALAAVVCFVMMMVMLILYVDQSRKVDDLGHYLHAIYQQAPGLREAIEKRE